MTRELYCNAEECVHQYSGLCSAKTINITGKAAESSNATECRTFSRKGFASSVTDVPTNTNVPGGIKQLFNGQSAEMSPDIKCEATKCNYNVEKKCSASNVQIYGPKTNSADGTQCETFRL